ncbi:lasso RiPP family leader peptide-containing protein [Saccharopolyspora sp. NPDC050642]
MTEQTFTDVYIPPMLVEVGEFNEDTLGSGFFGGDSFAEYGQD